MKIRFCSLLLIPLLTSTGCDQLQTSLNGDKTASTPAADTATAIATANATDSSEVVATVNGAPITRTVLEVYAGQRTAKGADEATTEAVLNELVTLELMRQEADSKGLGSQPMVIASLNQLQRSALAGAAIKDFMEKNPITDADAKTYYDEQIGVPGKEYKARHILVETEEIAKTVISMLDGGMDFSELAREKSTDSSGANGGELGWFSPQQMVKEFSDAAAALEKGSYTKSPVQSQFGWHVIMLEDVRDSTPPPFDEVKDRLKMGLANQSLQQHIQQIRETAKIEIR